MGLRSHIDPQPAAGSIPLTNHSLFFDYTVVNGLRYSASRRAVTSASSLVQCVVNANGDTSVGELTDIIHINQAPHGIFSFARVRWFRPLRLDLTDTVWHAL